jgi:hypothetical protein
LIPLQRREEIFGPVADGRECGGCTVCCTYTKIDTPELQKDYGVTCGHCTESGCGIYETRFPVCRSWQCLWKHIGSLPDEARPDESGIFCVLDQPQESVNLFARKCIRITIIDSEKAERSDLLIPLVDMFCQGDLPVWLDEMDGEMTLLHPATEVAREVLGESPVSAEALRWKAGVRN